VACFLVFMEYLDADGLFLLGEAVDLDGLELAAVGPVGNCHVHSGRQDTDSLNVVGIICIPRRLPLKATKSISGRSMSFLASTLPTGKAILG